MSLRYVWVGLLGWHASYQSLMLHSYKRALHQYQGGWLLFESCGNLIFVSCIRNSILPALQYNVHRAPGGGGGGRGTSAPPPPHFFAQEKYKRFKTYWRGNYILFYDLNFIALIFYCLVISATQILKFAVGAWPWIILEISYTFGTDVSAPYLTSLSTPHALQWFVWSLILPHWKGAE